MIRFNKKFKFNTVCRKERKKLLLKEVVLIIVLLAKILKVIDQCHRWKMQNNNK